MENPLFISDQNYCRRLFLPYKRKINPKAKKIISVKGERLGGFLDRSYLIKYSILIQTKEGKKVTHTFYALSSPDPTRFQSWRVMNYLWENNFSSEKYSIPEPLAFFKKHSMIVTREIIGKSFFDILKEGSQKKISLALKESASWLKKLHAIPIYRFRDVFSLSFSKIYWREQFRILKTGFPKKINSLKNIINEILSWEEKNRKEKNLKICHHDFHPKNIFLGKKKIWVLDFSESRLSRPIVDIFSFLIQLELMNNLQIKRFSSGLLRKFSKIFLREYFGKRWKKILKDPELKRDFKILKKRIAAQALVGLILFNKKPKILSKILFN